MNEITLLSQAYTCNCAREIVYVRSASCDASSALHLRVNMSKFSAQQISKCTQQRTEQGLSVSPAIGATYNDSLQGFWSCPQSGPQKPLSVSLQLVSAQQT